jgi:hypothetical protein
MLWVYVAALNSIAGLEELYKVLLVLRLRTDVQDVLFAPIE